MKRPELIFTNKVALITGSAGGIGEAIARNFAAAGAEVFLHDVMEDKLQTLCRDFTSNGMKSNYKCIDITVSGAARELVKSVVQQMGRIDILVNAAGINRREKSADVIEKNWDDVHNVNLKALFFVSQAAAREMIKQGGGKIVNISSQGGITALPMSSSYCSSKGAVNHLTRNLAVEWAEHNINVNAIAPTFVLTPLTESRFKDNGYRNWSLGNIPLGRWATPDEIAYATLFLASDLADMITGHILVVDGGWTCK